MLSLHSKFMWLLSASLLLVWPTGTRAHETTVIIAMTEEGFSPREVTVDEHAIINFINKDRVDRWPASNLHPTHDLYPAFDPGQPIAPGNFWIFRPTQPGTWYYHDHLFPHRKGTITVTGMMAPSPREGPWWQTIRTILGRWLEQLRTVVRRPESAVLGAADFTNLPTKDQYAYIRTLIDEHGLAAAWDYIKAAYTDQSGASLGGPVHDLAHHMGSLIWQERGLPGLSLCDASFAFGCYHGFTEAAFTDSLARLPEVARACETLGPVASGKWASCIHGVGHGVATYYNATDLTPALAACDHLKAGATYCHDGVFMEFSFSAPTNFYPADNPLYPCPKLAPAYRHACARNQTHVLERRHNFDRRQASTVCLAAEPVIATACIETLGFAIANESVGEAAAIIARCQELPPAAVPLCAAAAAGELVFQNFPDWHRNAPAICEALAEPDRPACHQRIERTRQDYRQ